MSSTCGICGTRVESRVPESWHPRKLVRRAERDMQAHLQTHTFAELLRYEIRKDLDQVPDEQRPAIVRDVYRQLLGTYNGKQYTLGDLDSRGLYSLDEALGSLSMYRLWRSSSQCALPACLQHE